MPSLEVLFPNDLTASSSIFPSSLLVFRFAWNKGVNDAWKKNISMVDFAFDWWRWGRGREGGGRRGRMQDGDGVGYLRCINNYAIFSAAVMNFTIANAQVVQDLIGMYGSMGFLSASKCLSV